MKSKNESSSNANAKIFVPEWRKKELLEEMHGGRHVAGHAGRDRLHPRVSSFAFVMMEN